MGSYEAIRWYPSRARRYTSDRNRWYDISDTIDGLTAPENESIMGAIDAQIVAIQADYKECKTEAISDFNNIMRDSKVILIDGHEVDEYDAIIRRYADAVVIVEGNSRTVFWMGDKSLNFQDLSPRLEIWLEAGNLIKDWEELHIPF